MIDIQAASTEEIELEHLCINSGNLFSESYQALPILESLSPGTFVLLSPESKPPVLVQSGRGQAPGYTCREGCPDTDCFVAFHKKWLLVLLSVCLIVCTPIRGIRRPKGEVFQ